MIERTAVLADADVVVAHGGTALTARALLAGVPMLLFPQVAEQELIAKRVTELGASVTISASRAGANGIARALHQLIETGSYRQAARRIADRYKGYDAAQTVERLADAILDTAERGDPP